MVTAEEKKQFLQRWLACIGTDGQTLELQQQLYDLLLRDTSNGKLYKYRSFDKKGYALKSLKSGTLYCANPLAFNDPFDCKIGITFRALAQAIVGPVCAVMDEILDSYLCILREERTIQSYSEDEQRILARLLGNGRLTNFIQEVCHSKIPEDQQNNVLKNNATVVFDLLHAVIADEFFAPLLGPVADHLPLIMENITMAGLEVMLTQDATYEMFANAMGITEDTDDIGLSMCLSKKLLPDQQDSISKAHEIITDLESNLINISNQLFRIGCLCTDYKNRLMWSHYADSHRGFCIEYAFDSPNSIAQLALPLPVVYSDLRPQIPWEESLNKTPENTAKATATMMIGLLTKDSCWKYENEWRFLVVSPAGPKLKMPKISCIYLGALVNPRNRSKLIKFAKKNNIPVKQMTVDRGEYLLHASEIP